MKKVYIFYTSIGTGHLSAAMAVKAAIQEGRRDVQVELYDAFPQRYQNMGLSRILMALSQIGFPRLYNWSWQTGSFLWLFRLFSRFPAFKERVVRICYDGQPDAILCTHAMPCAILIQANTLLENIPVIAVSTDFQVHPYWPTKRVAEFVVASLAASHRFHERGVSRNQIHVAGIPVHPSFSKAVRINREIDGKTRVLVIAGGGGQANYLQIYPIVYSLIKRLSARPIEDIQWRFIFGHSRFLEIQAARLLSDRVDVESYQYIENMSEHMAWADLIMSKAGGVTLAEAFALGKPVAILSRGAGQEAANVDVVLSCGAGLLLRRAEGIFRLLEDIKAGLNPLYALQANAVALGSPDAAYRVADLIEKYIPIESGLVNRD